MLKPRGLAQLGMLAVGPGIGATVASTPTQRQRVSADWWADLLALF
jgi:hypothetical protein